MINSRVLPNERLGSSNKIMMGHILSYMSHVVESLLSIEIQRDENIISWTKKGDLY